MGDFLYRLSYGLTGRKLTALLQREQPQDSPSADGPPPPGPWTSSGEPGPPEADAGGGAAGLRNNAEVSVLVSINDTVASRDRRQGRSLVRKQKALVAAAHGSLDTAIRLKTTRAHPRWVNESLAGKGESLTVPG